MSVLKPLRHRQFRRLFVGMSVGRIGDAMAVVALVWTTLQHHSAGALGGVLLAGAVPSLVAAPLAGSLVQRLGIRRAVRWDCVLRGVLCLAVAAALAVGVSGMWLIVVFAILNTCLGSLSGIALDVATPELLPDDALQEGNALVSAVWDLADLIGPALAGFAIAGGGPSAAFVIDAASFAVMVVVMPAAEGASIEKPRSLWTGTAEGFRLLATRYRLSAVLTLVSLFVLTISGAQEVLLPVMLRSHLHASAATYGLVVSTCGAATLIGTTVLSPLAGRISTRRALLSAFIVRGIGVAATGLGVSAISLGAAAAVAAASDGPIYPTLRTTQQRLVPAQHRASVAGARGSLGSLGYPLGNALGGLVATLDPRLTYLTLGLLHLAPIAILVSALPMSSRHRSN